MEQGEKSERSRAQILEAALDLFSRQGYRGTSIRDISKAAGVSTGSVYHHFNDKEELFDNLFPHIPGKIIDLPHHDPDTPGEGLDIPGRDRGIDAHGL